MTYPIQHPPVPMKPKKEASIDTLALTESLGLKTHRRECRKTWSKADDQQLLDRLAACYPQQMASNTVDARTVDWDAVAAVFAGSRKPNSCKKRWTTSLDPRLRRGKWTPEEDRHLVEMYNKYGALWRQVASHIPGRTEHQCSKRYFEVLDPSVANRLQPWSEAEDLRLIDLVEQHGTKWRTIAQTLESRPPLTCRNRWRNLLTSVVRERASGRIMARMAEVAPLPASPGVAPPLPAGGTPPPEQKPVPPAAPARPAAPPGPAVLPDPAVLAQVRSAAKLPATTEWRYELAAPADSPVPPTGVISSMSLVEALVSQAARLHVKLELHQHHHFSQDALSPHSSGSSDRGAERRVAPLALGPDVHVTRFQHFNYLPPSTPLPQLQSSASSPDVHGEAKESDLRRLLNGHEPHAGHSSDTSARAAARAPGPAPKRPRVAADIGPDAADMGADLGPDAALFGPIPALLKPDEVPAKGHVPLRPVSQHHPLHSSGAMPRPEDWGMDEEEEDFMSAFGFHACVRDKPLEPAPSEHPDEFFPFNPS